MISTLVAGIVALSGSKYPIDAMFIKLLFIVEIFFLFFRLAEYDKPEIPGLLHMQIGGSEWRKKRRVMSVHNRRGGADAARWAEGANGSRRPDRGAARESQQSIKVVKAKRVTARMPMPQTTGVRDDIQVTFRLGPLGFSVVFCTFNTNYYRFHIGRHCASCSFVHFRIFFIIVYNID